MGTGEEEAETSADNPSPNADDQSQNLEGEHNQAREGKVVSEEYADGPSDPLEASNERFQLLTRVADLTAEVARYGDELDERDRMLAELGEQIAGFQADIAERDKMLEELHEAKQAMLEERREKARIQALLDARAVERQELADVAQRMQNERDNVQELLTSALARTDELEAAQTELDDALRHVEAARDTAAQEHDVRAHELVDARAEISKLQDQLVAALEQQKVAVIDAEKSEALAERRANEARYLNRRIDALTEKLESARSVETTVNKLRSQADVDERRISELDRTIVSLQGELDAANAAVDSIASRTSDYDELVAKIATLEEERDAAWEAASGSKTSGREQTSASGTNKSDATSDQSENAERAANLAARARELGARRAREAAEAAEAAEQAAAEHAKAQAARALATEQAAADARANAAKTAQDSAHAEDLAAAAAPYLAELNELGPPPAQGERTVAPEFEEVPRIEFPAEAPQFVFEQSSAAADLSATQEVPAISIDDDAPATEIPQLAVPQPASPVVEPEQQVAPAEFQTPTLAVPEMPPVGLEPPAMPKPVPAADLVAARKRTVLPADMLPNTPDAVSYLLNQPGVIAIVDARSTCARTGVRPSELFDRVAALRDHFDSPMEVVVTPVSTPVGGAPDLPAIGVHHVTGADTVADRIRALCMGFPADQPLVVVAGDDHVRRAAIGEEANVVEPAAVLNFLAE